MSESMSREKAQQSNNNSQRDQRLAGDWVEVGDSDPSAPGDSDRESVADSQRAIALLAERPDLPLVLASASPRRAQLLQSAGYRFRVQAPTPTAESGRFAGESAGQMVRRLAWQKAANIADQLDRALVLAADTVADCHGEILGKPRDRQHAGQMLRLMMGQRHQVWTGLCLWHCPTQMTMTDMVRSDLEMTSLTEAQIQTYLDTGAWRGKAGAFGFQDGLDWVHLVQGEATNVVGLPLPRLAEMLVRMLGMIAADQERQP